MHRLICFFLTGALMFPASSLWASELVDRVVAVVNGEIITLFEINDQLGKMAKQQQGTDIVDPSDPQYDALRRQLLDNKVNDLLLKQEADRLGVSISDGELNNRIEEIKKKNGMTDSAFNMQLANEGLTLDEFKKSLKIDTLRKRIIGFMVHRKVLVTDDEILQYYRENGGAPLESVSVLTSSVPGNIGFIMTSTPAQAADLRKRIAGGELTFSDAARKYSIGPGKAQGGFLGDVTLNDLAPPLRKALEGAPRGEVSQPVELDGKGVLLIMRAEGQAAPKPAAKKEQPAPSDAGSDGLAGISQAERDQIREILYRKKFDVLVNEYMNNLRSKSVVDIRL